MLPASRPFTSFQFPLRLTNPLSCLQATPAHVAQLRAIFEKQRAGGSSPEAALLDQFWWLISDTTLTR
jgi:hypothetical protein